MRYLPLLLVSMYSFGQQNPKVDSLLNVLGKASHDTTRILALDALSELTSHDYNAIEKYGNQMKELSEPHLSSATGREKTFYYHHYATALNNLAYVEENKSHPDLAAELYQKSLSIFREISEKPGEAMVLLNLGFSAKKRGELGKAIEYYSEAYEINKEVDNKSGMFGSLNNLGLVFFSMGDMKKALSNYYSAMKIATELNDKRRIALSYNNIAGVYSAQKEYRLQLDNLEKALALIIETGDKRREVIIRGNMVEQLIAVGDMDKALDYSERAIEIAKETNDRDNLSSAYSTMVLVLRAKKQHPKAFELERESYEIRKSLGIRQAMAYSLASMGKISLDMNRMQDAIRFLSEAVQVYKETGNRLGVSQQLKNLSDAYRAAGNPEKALALYEQYVALRDSITNEESRKEAFRSQIKHDYELKAASDSIRALSEKAVLTAQINQERSQSYALIALIILGISAAAFVFYRFRVQQRMKELRLRNQIASDLHDEVGSAISSISLFAGLARMKSGKESEEIVEKIENTSRETVNNMSDIVWSIEPANDRFDNVLKKMIYFGEQLMNSLGISFNLAFEQGMEKMNFDMTRRKNIYLIYKEAINNAAKYSNASNVDVHLYKEGNRFVMEIKDNGKGFDHAATTLGNGLRNMKRRAEEIGGSLSIDSSSTGTLVTLAVNTL